MEQGEKHIFGAYLNMARHNVFITLSHISKLLGATKDGSESRLSEMKAITVLENGKPEEKEKAIKLLNKHFPSLKPMIDTDLMKRGQGKIATPGHYYDILTTSFDLLNLIRDQNSHYIFIDDRINEGTEKYNKIEEQESKTVDYLKNCFDGARRISKDRFGFTDNELRFLTGSGAGNRYDEIDKIDENGNVIYDNRNRKLKVRRERDDFAYKLWKTKRIAEKKGREVEINELSTVGVIFFICLFLEKKYATIFLDNSELRFFPENTQEIQKKIIREIFSIYRMRMPKARIDSEKEDFALGLDILNELKKCPDELFETLSQEDQDKFRIMSEKESEDIDNTEILMKRYQNRFPYFAMKYFDEKGIFSNIRFQVSLGKYRYEFYDKIAIDSNNDDRVRALQKELNGFGRLGEIEKIRKEEWTDYIRPYGDIKKDTADEKPYITDHRANYIINGNRVGIAFNSEYRRILDNGYFIPKIEGKETQCESPDCWLSIHELPAMIFHNILCDPYKKKETEKLIVEYVKQYRKLFSDIKSGALEPISNDKEEVSLKLKNEYRLDYHDIPEKIRDFLTKKDVDIKGRFNTLAEERIKKMLNWSERRLEKFNADLKLVGNRKENKIGKDGYVDIKPGQLARFLSEDIIMFQPTTNDGRDKLTGMNFQVMQSSLAIYDKSIEELKQMFINAKLVGGNIKHPFLSKVLDKNPENTIRFYEIYLQKRIEYLKSLKIENYKDQSKCSFLYAKRQKWEERNESFYTKLAERYLKQPIELPRGLFNDVIKDKLRSKYPENSKLIESLSQDRCNVSFLIVKFFEYVQEDEYQEFYSFKRKYDVFNKLIGEVVNRNQLKKQYYSPDELKQLIDKDKLEDIIEKYVNREALKAYRSGYKNFSKKIKAVKNFNPEYLVKSGEIQELFVKVLQQIKSNTFVSDDDLKKLIVFYEETICYRKINALLRDFKKNEKLLRQYKVQDILLFLMAKDILISHKWENNEIKEIEQYKLKNITADGDRNILAFKIPFSISIKLEDGTTKTIKQECLKVKNYGDFFRFIYDQRIQSLLPNIKSTEILDREVLEKELEGYDINRTLMFKLILEFEKSIISQNTDYMTQKHDFKNLLEVYHTDKDKDFIRLIRNAVCHNSYPKVNDLESKTKPVPKIAASLPNIFQSLVNKT